MNICFLKKNCHRVVILVDAGGSDLGENSQHIESYKMCFDTIATQRQCFFGRCRTLCKNAHPGLYLDSWCMDQTTCKCKYSC